MDSWQIKRYINKLKDTYWHSYSEIQIQVREATNDEPWAADRDLLASLAGATFNPSDCMECVIMIISRLENEYKGSKTERWRPMYKLLEYLLKHGSKTVKINLLDRLDFLTSFTIMVNTLDENDNNIQEKEDTNSFSILRRGLMNVQIRAYVVINLLSDDVLLEKERQLILQNKDKYIGFDSFSAPTRSSSHNLYNESSSRENNPLKGQNDQTQEFSTKYSQVSIEKRKERIPEKDINEILLISLEEHIEEHIDGNAIPSLNEKVSSHNEELIKIEKKGILVKNSTTEDGPYNRTDILLPDLTSPSTSTPLDYFSSPPSLNEVDVINLHCKRSGDAVSHSFQLYPSLSSKFSNGASNVLNPSIVQNKSLILNDHVNIKKEDRGCTNVVSSSESQRFPEWTTDILELVNLDSL